MYALRPDPIFIDCRVLSCGGTASTTTCRDESERLRPAKDGRGLADLPIEVANRLLGEVTLLWDQQKQGAGQQFASTWKPGAVKKGEARQQVT